MGLDTFYYLKIELQLTDDCTSEQNTKNIQPRRWVTERQVDDNIGIPAIPNDNMMGRDANVNTIRLRSLGLYSQPIGTWVSTNSSQKNLIKVISLESQ